MTLRILIWYIDFISFLNRVKCTPQIYRAIKLVWSFFSECFEATKIEKCAGQYQCCFQAQIPEYSLLQAL